MPLSLHFIKDRKEEPMVTFGVRLFLTSDGRVVEEGDPDAYQLLAGENAEIPLSIARQYDLVDEHGNLSKGAPKSLKDRITGSRTMVAADGTAVDPASYAPVLIGGEEHKVPQADVPNDALDDRHDVSMADAAQETAPVEDGETHEAKAITGPAATKAVPAPAATKAVPAKDAKAESKDDKPAKADDKK